MHQILFRAGVKENCEPSNVIAGSHTRGSLRELYTRKHS